MVYGATSSGIAAAIAATLNGGKVVLLDPGTHVGGMSAGGLGATDTGNPDTISGISGDFYRRMGARYGLPVVYDFEPHVAEEVFSEMLAQAGVAVLGNSQVISVAKTGTTIESLTTSDGTVHAGQVFIDATYEGDLMALAGVSHTFGREANDTYGETLNGVRVPSSPGGPNGNQLDPFVTPGIYESGLLPHVTAGPPAPPGTADRRVQAYNYRLCLTNDPNNRVEIAPPDAFDPQEYELLARWVSKIPLGGRSPTFSDLVNIRPLPNNKFDANAAWFVSTDLVGGSDAYPDADPVTRARIRAMHERYIRGHLHYLATSLRVPEALRAEASLYGLCADEFTDNDYWPHQLYVREGRRMLGAYVMTENDVLQVTQIADSVGLGSYAMDSHYTQRLNVNGQVQVEGAFYVIPPAPYPISYRSLTPRSEEATNLLVPVCLSASHVAYSSLRMEPVYMILGHSAGTAAALASAARVPVQQVTYSKLRAQLVKEGQLLSWP